MLEHEKISHLLQTSGLNVKSLRDYIHKEEEIQQKELDMLCHQFLHIPHTTKSDPLTLPSESSIPLKSNEEEKFNPLKIDNKLPHDNDNDSSSSSNSSSSSSGSSDSDNDMTKKLRQLLSLRTKPKSKKSSRHKSKRHFEKKAISLATKMIKQASRVNFHK